MGTKFFNKSVLDSIIRSYIGMEIYQKSSKEIKQILWRDAIKMFQLDMIQKHGSLREYQKDWLKRNGFINDIDYLEYLASINGLKTANQYYELMAKNAGFKSRYDRMLDRARKSGKDTLHGVYCDRYKKRGFNNQREYRKFLAKKNGYKNYSQLLKANKLKRLQNITK